MRKMTRFSGENPDLQPGRMSVAELRQAVFTPEFENPDRDGQMAEEALWNELSAADSLREIQEILATPEKQYTLTGAIARRRPKNPDFAADTVEMLDQNADAQLEHLNAIFVRATSATADMTPAEANSHIANNPQIFFEEFQRNEYKKLAESFAFKELITRLVREGKYYAE